MEKSFVSSNPGVECSSTHERGRRRSGKDGEVVRTDELQDSLDVEKTLEGFAELVALRTKTRWHNRADT